MGRLRAAISAGLVNARNSEGQSPLHISASGWVDGQYLAVMKALTDAGADIHAVDGKGWTPLHQVVATGMSMGLNHLLLMGASVNAAAANGDTPLCLALRR